MMLKDMIVPVCDDKDNVAILELMTRVADEEFFRKHVMLLPCVLMQNRAQFDYLATSLMGHLSPSGHKDYFKTQPASLFETQSFSASIKIFMDRAMQESISAFLSTEYPVSIDNRRIKRQVVAGTYTLGQWSLNVICRDLSVYMSKASIVGVHGHTREQITFEISPVCFDIKLIDFSESRSVSFWSVNQVKYANKPKYSLAMLRAEALSYEQAFCKMKLYRFGEAVFIYFYRLRETLYRIDHGDDGLKVTGFDINSDMPLKKISTQHHRDSIFKEYLPFRFNDRNTPDCFAMNSNNLLIVLQQKNDNTARLKIVAVNRWVYDKPLSIIEGPSTKVSIPTKTSPSDAFKIVRYMIVRPMSISGKLYCLTVRHYLKEPPMFELIGWQEINSRCSILTAAVLARKMTSCHRSHASCLIII